MISIFHIPQFVPSRPSLSHACPTQNGTYKPLNLQDLLPNIASSHEFSKNNFGIGSAYCPAVARISPKVPRSYYNPAQSGPYPYKFAAPHHAPTQRTTFPLLIFHISLLTSISCHRPFSLGEFRSKEMDRGYQLMRLKRLTRKTQHWMVEAAWGTGS
jgi:hypothetical protein